MGALAELSPRGLALRARQKAERDRRKRARHAAQFGPQAELCRRGPCQGCGLQIRRKHGGLDRDTCALCEFVCHKAVHKSREDFEARVGRSVSSMVEEMRERLAASGGR